MTRPHSKVPEDEALRKAADLILKRALEVKVPAAKDRALELARLVLGGNPEFGGREVRDQQIVQALEAENIGLATFKKALSTARKELVKRPARPSRARVPAPRESVATAVQGQSAPSHAEYNAVAATLPRQLL